MNINVNKQITEDEVIRICLGPFLLLILKHTQDLENGHQEPELQKKVK